MQTNAHHADGQQGHHAPNRHASWNGGHLHYDPTPQEAVERLNERKHMHTHIHAAKNWFGRTGRVLVAGAGFLADAYDLFVINIALLMMKQVDYGVKQTPDIKAQVSMMAIVGALTGQVLFGLLGDQFGRKWTFIATAGLTILGTCLQCVAFPTKGMNIYQQLMLYRFFMGVGVGGEYPMASTVTSEGSTSSTRGRNLAAVFAMQGVGRILCALVLMICAYTIKDYNIQWRIAILCGAIPMMLCISFRWMPESEAYQESVVAKLSAGERLKIIGRTVWENRWRLMGTAGSWFILDVVFYGNSLFSADVTAAMGGKHTVKTEATSNLWIQLMAMPGYIVGMLLIDWAGRKNLQMFGFTGEAIIFGIMAIFLEKLKGLKGLFIFLYALTFFFDDCGPNLTTFVIPAEIFPTESRSTCHGISAACGKAGAAVGAWAFSKITNHWCYEHTCSSKHARQKDIDKGMRAVFICCACLAFLGLIWTIVFIDDRPHDSLKIADAIMMDDEEARQLEAIAAQEHVDAANPVKRQKEVEMTHETKVGY